jgi:hypothetical protein
MADQNEPTTEKEYPSGMEDSDGEDEFVVIQEDRHDLEEELNEVGVLKILLSIFKLSLPMD